MNVPLNQLVDFFAEAPIHFREAYSHEITSPCGSSSGYTSVDSSALVFTHSGSANIFIGGTQYKCEHGIILHASCKMKLDIQVIGRSSWKYSIINYRLADEDQSHYSLYKQNFVMLAGANNGLSQQLLTLISCYQQATPMSTLHAKSGFYQWLRHMLHAVQQQTKTSKAELMLEAVQYMHECYNKPISVTQVSQQIGIERRRFAYLFERYTGMTPNHYLTSFRMKRSRELLRAQHYTVAQVAELVGYHDSFYFSRVFKKYNGLSPSDYRKKLNPHSS